MKIVKKILKVLLIILIVIIVIGVIFVPIDIKKQKEVRNLSIEKVDLTKLEDGKYTGNYKKYRWNYNVEVTINNHKITDINIINDMYNNDKFNNELIGNVIEKQNVDVDTVSGATISSKVMLKAIENALNK